MFEGFPLIVGWELTLKCNLNCRHCGSNAGFSRPDELSLEESLSICNQFPDLLVQKVTFTGGEPLLQPHWFLMADRLAKLGITTYMVTNGILLDSTVFLRIRKAGIAQIAISLDGLQATHDRIRGQEGLFKRVMSAIQMVASSQIPLTIITTINALNIVELPSLFDLLHTLGVHSWQLQPLFPMGRSQNSLELRITEKDYMSAGACIKDLISKSKDAQIDIRPGDSLGFFSELDTRQPSWKGCNAGIVECGITSNGLVKGCLALPDNIVEGDLRERDFWDIWFSPNSFKYTRGFNLSELGSSCNLCEKAIECKGGCSAMSYSSTGHFHNDPYCFMGIKTRNFHA